jgi:hypothetical protein
MEQTNLLLAQALDEYYMADPATQAEYIQHVKDMLERHEKYSVIGFDYAEAFVEAGKLFLNEIAGGNEGEINKIEATEGEIKNINNTL